jgi:TolB-like protein
MPTEPLTDPFACDAFISYASKDKAAADALCASLERRGLRCWIAPRDVRPGALYADAIVRALNGSKALVLLLSQYSVASTHVGKEIERASSKRRPIITLRLDAAPLTPALEYFLSESQWVDVDTAGFDAATEHIGLALEATLTGSTLTGSTPTATALPRSPRQRSPWIPAAVIGFLVIVGGILLARHWQTTPASAAPTLPAGAATTRTATAPTAPSVPAAQSVAVLPFEDLSEKKDQGYFSDGLSSELIDLLANVQGLRVPARMSSFYFKGKAATLQDIAHALNVSHVLEGTVRSSGQNLRITTDLVSVDTGTPIWSQTYDRKLDDIFKIQDDIAGSVVSALKISLLRRKPVARPTANPAAYRAYLQCYDEGYSESREAAAAGIRYCEQSVALDPTYAPAWTGLAFSYITAFSGFGMYSYSVARDHILAAAQRAIALDPNFAAAHLALAQLYYQMDFDPAAADVEIKRAIALDLDSSDAKWLEGYLASIQGRYDEARSALATAQSHDPLWSEISLQLGNVGYRSGRYDDAKAGYRSALDIEPKIGSVHYRLGLVALLEHDPATALAEFEREPDRDFRAVGLPMAYDALGRKADADRAIVAAERAAATMGAAYQMALVYAARKDSVKTLEWLERAHTQRDPGMLWIKGEPFLRFLEPEPRFQTLLREMHLAG